MGGTGGEDPRTSYRVTREHLISSAVPSTMPTSLDVADLKEAIDRLVPIALDVDDARLFDVFDPEEDPNIFVTSSNPGTVLDALPCHEPQLGQVVVSKVRLTVNSKRRPYESNVSTQIIMGFAKLHVPAFAL